jgi:hypothetical protein
MATARCQYVGNEDDERNDIAASVEVGTAKVTEKKKG